MYNTTPTITHTIAQRSAAIRAHTRAHTYGQLMHSHTPADCGAKYKNRAKFVKLRIRNLG